MIRCNLAVLLAERNLKITQVSKDTGISRTTLTSLYHNNGQGIQFDTLNTLCLYLKVTPEKIISFTPVDLTLDHCSFSSNGDLEIYFIFVYKGTKYKSQLFGFIAKDSSVLGDDDNSYLPDQSMYITIDFFDPEDLSPSDIILKEYISSLPATFKNDIEDAIIDYAINNCDGFVRYPEVIVDWEF